MEMVLTIATGVMVVSMVLSCLPIFFAFLKFHSVF